MSSDEQRRTSCGIGIVIVNVVVTNIKYGVRV